MKTAVCDYAILNAKIFTEEFVLCLLLVLAHLQRKEWAPYRFSLQVRASICAHSFELKFFRFFLFYLSNRKRLFSRIQINPDFPRLFFYSSTWFKLFPRECRNYHRNVIAGENDNWWRCGTGSVQFFRKVDLVVISCWHSAEEPLWQQLARAEWREDAMDIFVGAKYLEFVFRRHLQKLYFYFWTWCSYNACRNYRPRRFSTTLQFSGWIAPFVASVISNSFTKVLSDQRAQRVFVRAEKE